MGCRAVERVENKLNKIGSLLNLKQTMLESIKVPHESVPFFRLKNALIPANNFRLSRCCSNLIASVATIQQITYLIGLWIERIICTDYSPAVPAACWWWWSTDGLMDGQKDSEWEGNHQPPGLIHGGKKKKNTSDPAVLMAQTLSPHNGANKCITCEQEHEACKHTALYFSCTFYCDIQITRKHKAMQNIRYTTAKEAGLHIMKLKRLSCCNIPGVYSYSSCFIGGDKRILSGWDAG